MESDTAWRPKEHVAGRIASEAVQQSPGSAARRATRGETSITLAATPNPVICCATHELMKHFATDCHLYWFSMVDAALSSQNEAEERKYTCGAQDPLLTWPRARRR